jgi:hypothetical protein
MGVMNNLLNIMIGNSGINSGETTGNKHGS